MSHNPNKSKKKPLSLQSMTTRSKQNKMNITKPGKPSFSGDHNAFDSNPESSQLKVTKNLTDENRAKSNVNPNTPNLDNVICEGESSLPAIEPQDNQENINVDSQNRVQSDLALARAEYNQKIAEAQKLEAQEELAKLKNMIKKLDIKLAHNKVDQISNHYERELSPRREHFFENYENSYRNSINNNFNDTFRAQRLSKKFKRLDVVKNPRDTINYFEEELYDEGIVNDLEKYNYLIGFWPRVDISDYYKMSERTERNYRSLKNFCLNRDNELTEILDKIPIWETKTTFNQIYSTASKWAKCPEEDRIKFFLAYLMPSSIKSKIKEYYDAELDVFRRKSQAIWNAHKENALQTRQVDYNRLRRPERNHYTNKNSYQVRNRSNPQQTYQKYSNSNNNLDHQQQNRNNTNSNQSFQRYRDNERRGFNYSNSYSRPYAHTNDRNRQQGNDFPSSRQ